MKMEPWPRAKYRLTGSAYMPLQPGGDPVPLSAGAVVETDRMPAAIMEPLDDIGRKAVERREHILATRATASDMSHAVAVLAAAGYTVIPPGKVSQDAPSPKPQPAATPWPAPPHPDKAV